MQHAISLRGKNKKIKGLKLVEKALIDDPFFLDLNYLYAQLLIDIGRFDDAEKQLKRVIALYGHHTYAQNDLGVIYQKRDDTEHALERFKIALSIDNKNYGAIKNLLNLLVSIKREADAKNIANTLLMHHPMDQKIYELTKNFVSEMQKEVSLFVRNINPTTISRHDDILGWAEDCLTKKGHLENPILFEKSDDPVVKQGYILRNEVAERFKNCFLCCKTNEVKINYFLIYSVLIRRFSKSNLLNLLIFYCCNARQHFSFKVLQHSAATRANIAYLICQVEFIHGRHTIATAHQAKSAVGCRCRHRFCNDFCSCLEFFHFKNAHRAVP